MDKIELTEDEFLTKIKEANLSDYLAKYTQKIGDKRTSEGISTFKKNLEKKDLSDKERLEAVETELAELKLNTAKGNINNLIEAELGKQNLSKGLLKYIKVDSNDPSEIAESVISLKNDLLEIKQGEIDQRLKEDGGIPLKGDQAGAGSGMESVARSYAKKISIKEK